jgi:hypothetical protein
MPLFLAVFMAALAAPVGKGGELTLRGALIF